MKVLIKTQKKKHMGRPATGSRMIDFFVNQRKLDAIYFDQLIISVTFASYSFLRCVCVRFLHTFILL